jgi:hypothetical protein
MSLPNGAVSMRFEECAACLREGHTFGDGQPLGVRCGGCGHHFHIGPEILVETTPLFCPRCEGACLPFEIAEASE